MNIFLNNSSSFDVFSQNSPKSSFNHLKDAVVVCDGNSLTHGAQASDPSKAYPAQMATLSNYAPLHPVTINIGVNGQQTSDMISRAPSFLQPLYAHNRPRNYVVAWEIGNDIFFNGDAIGAYNRFAQYCITQKANGWRVVVINVPYRDNTFMGWPITPGGDTPDQYTSKVNIANALLKQNYTQYSVGLVDLAGDPRFQSFDPTYYNADHTHLTDTGYLVVAELVAFVLTIVQ
jgi:lysophospholipase L1-like esterase